MTIGERIKKRRLELELSIDDVAKRLGKNRATVYRYESDYILHLPITVLEPLAEVLQTSPAYLMGWGEQEGTSENLGNKLRTALEIKKTTLSELSIKTGISKSLLSQYILGQALPKEKHFSLLVETLDINPLWLLGYDLPMEMKAEISTNDIIKALNNYQKKSHEYIEVSQHELKLLNKYRLLNDEGRKKAETYVSDLTTIPKYLEE